MVNLAALTAANLARWNKASVTPSLLHFVDSVAHRLVDAKDRYEKVSATTHVPWPVIAVIHERESSQSWTASLAQGDPWNRVSIHIPRGRGPFQSWEAAAEDALAICPPHAAVWSDWSIGGALCLLEQYNGLGYASGPFDHATGHQYPPQASPYVWASTDQYVKGKYIADGHFDPNAVDHQIGAAALLARMSLIDRTIPQEWHP